MEITNDGESFRLLVDSVQDYAILMLDSTGSVASWNSGAQRIKGYTAEEILGRHFSVFYTQPDIDRGWPDEELTLAAAEGRLEDEGWRVRQDGSRFWANVVITALREDGELVGFAKVTRDLSERKRAEDERERLLEREREARREAESLTEELRMQAHQLEEQSAEMEAQVEELQDQASRLEEKRSDLERANRELQRRNVELRAAEEHYHRLVDNAPAGVFVLDVEGRFTEINRSGERILERPAAELLGAHFGELVAPEDLDLATDTFMRMITGRDRLLELDIGVQRPSGEHRLVNILLASIEEDGRVVGLHGTSRDITDDRRTRESLRESEASYRSLFDSITEMVYIQDLDGRFLNVNDAVLERYGYAREEIVGQNAELLLDSERSEMAHVHECFRAAESGVPQRLEVWGLARGGESFPKELSLTLGRYFGDDVVIGVARDITHRKRAEVVAERSREFYMSLFDRFPALIWRANPQGECDYFNRAWLEFTGRAMEQEIGRGWTEGVHPEDEARRSRICAAAFEAREPFELEYRLRHQSGHHRWIRDFGRPVHNLEGEFIGYIGGAFDIDAQRRAETQLRQAQKMEAVGRLAGGIAHDFNNVLMVIEGNARMTLMDLPDDSPIRPDLEEITEAAERAANLTRQLLSFSRQEVLQPRVIDLNEVISDVQRMLRRMLGEDIELVSVLDAELGQVRADPGRIQQILMNLAVNARDAMPTGGKLITETKNFELTERIAGNFRYDVQPGQYVMLAISDTGSGMSREVKERVFEPFFTTKPQGEGTGLGLSTVYGIVKQSGGYVWLYTEEGHGTTFTVLLPRVDAAVQPIAAPRPEPRQRRSATILLVEDEPAVRSTARRMLERLGHLVLEAENGEEGLRVAEEQGGEIDLLLTDVVMPVMGGRELAERVIERWPDVRVLYTSGYTDEAVVRHGIQEGSAAFLQKPYDPFSLAEKVAEALDEPAGDL